MASCPLCDAETFASGHCGTCGFRVVPRASTSYAHVRGEPTASTPEELPAEALVPLDDAPAPSKPRAVDPRRPAATAGSPPPRGRSEVPPGPARSRGAASAVRGSQVACPRCRSPNASSVALCEACGFRLRARRRVEEDEVRRCRECGVRSPSDKTRCINCGFRL